MCASLFLRAKSHLNLISLIIRCRIGKSINLLLKKYKLIVAVAYGRPYVLILCRDAEIGNTDIVIDANGQWEEVYGQIDGIDKK